MFYPAYIHHENGSFGIQFPDFPGCFSVSETFDGITRNALEAVQAHYSDGEPVPLPSVAGLPLTDPEYRAGFWMMIDIDLSKVNSKAVRLNISLPENLVQKIDAAADARRLSRSAFLAIAAEHEMEKA